MSVLIFILILSFLVLIHELGHFFVARRAGVIIEEFGIGYPPRAIKLFVWKGTVFSLNWIPFGGFVRMAGEEGQTGDEVPAASHQKDKRNKSQDQTSKGMFYQASNINKLLIIVAGAAVNFIFGVVAFTIVFGWMGIPVELTEARIAQVAEGSPAHKAGLQPGVSIIGLLTETEDHVEIHTSQQLVDKIREHQGKTVKLMTTGPCQGMECEPNGQTVETYLRTQAETPEGQGSLGIVFEPVVFVRYPWWQMPFRSVWYGLQQAVFLGQEIIRALGAVGKDFVSKGSVPDELAGPVGIVHQAQASGLFSQGPLALLSFMGMLSVNLAIMNMLPIPPLDGGRAVLILISPLMSKKYLQRVEYYASYSGYIALILLIILITIRDVGRVIFS
ncbi:site-2 protease family protein [Candidatus Woesebacteria bacterium]|nr:site-2 protease family protein [Candidatus Woesebacteria bacterium]